MLLPWGFIADAVLIVLLVATLVHVVRLSRRLAELRQDRQSFETLIAEFAKATAEAQRGVAELRLGAEGVGRELNAGIERGQSVVGELQHSADDLKMLINRAESAAGKLEAAIGISRQQNLQPARTPEKAAPETAAPATDPIMQDPQTRALLSALGRIR
jgi:septal ring factor EnvC (AmiA/AmiB activator)